MYEPPLHREDDLGEAARADPRAAARAPDQPRSAGAARQRHSVPARPAASRLGTLRAHMARANPQWRDLAREPRGARRLPGRRTITSRRPGTRPSGRPTRSCRPGTTSWSRRAGQRRVIEDDEWLSRQIEALTRSQEAAREEPWAVSRRAGRFHRAAAQGDRRDRDRDCATSGANGRRARTAAPPTAPAWSPASRRWATRRRSRWPRSSRRRGATDRSRLPPARGRDPVSSHVSEGTQRRNGNDGLDQAALHRSCHLDRRPQRRNPIR